MDRNKKKGVRPGGPVGRWLVAIMLCGVGIVASAGEKATICHKPGTSAEKTLLVAVSAITAHIQHGDTLGACGTSPPPVACGPRTTSQASANDGLPNDAEEEFISEAKATLEGASTTAFNAAGAPVTFRLSCSTLQKKEEAIIIYDNGAPIPFASLTLTDDAVTITEGLTPGQHELNLLGTDIYGATIEAQVVVWAGNQSIPVVVRDEAGSPVEDATVEIKLSDNPNVSAVLITDSNGQVTFNHLPDRSYNIIVHTADNRLGTRPASLVDGTVVAVVNGFKPSNAIDNNDFAQGLAGWEIGNAPVQLVPHVEMLASTLLATTMSAEDATAKKTKPVRDVESSHKFKTTLQPAIYTAAADSDTDLKLSTSGEGQQSISRTFDVQDGVKSVTVRFRFITSEVPGGYFGTEFNDFFNVSLRTLKAGGSTTNGNSMNGLGLAAFDGSGTTNWYEVELPVADGGDTVQVDVAVANVADGLFDSSVVVDIVKKKTVRISKLQINDIDNTALQYLSASNHVYFGGNTRVNGTFTIEGAADDSISSVELEVLEGGSIATGALVAELSPTVLTQFGDDEQISLSTSQLLFKLPAAQLAAASQTSNGSLTLRMKVTTASGETATKDFGPVTKLTKFSGGARYGGRDADVGGDDWAKPTVNTFIESVGLTWGDFSNMNGGSFAPDHQTHRTGNSADGWFAGYNARDAATAATIIGHLNTHGTRIRTVYVTFTPISTFAQTITNVTLDDGRSATSVIRNVSGHTTHFHWEITE